MAWRAARSLLVLHQQLKTGAARAAPPATGDDEWGLIGDAAHDPTSDHAPKGFIGWGSQIVTAADFPNRPDLGLDAHQVLDDIRRSRDPRGKYGISNGLIWSNHPVTEHGHSYEAWEWRPYLTSTGKKPADGHYTHGHLSVVGDARADGEQPWQTIGGSKTAAALEGDEDDMGASFGPITIEREGETSLTVPPVQGGGADPRAAWLNLCNAADGKPYALRIWFSRGSSLEPFTLGGCDADGMRVFLPGGRWSQELPANTAGLYISRKAVKQGDDGLKAVEPTAELQPFGGHLTCAIERGAVIKH
jgi:hypothetical protein